MKLPIYSERIVTFSVIYHPYRRDTERFIRAFGAFEVNFQPGDDVLFTRHHHTGLVPVSCRSLNFIKPPLLRTPVG